VAPPAAEAAPAPSDGGATRLADEMLAMFSGSEQSPAPAAGALAPPTADPFAPSTDQLDAAARPSADIDPADELLDELARSAEEESKRRWFNR
jgi:hypothetical protein